MSSVNLTIKNHLCSMCGACMAVCPKGAIGIRKSEEKKFTIAIDSDKCVECGLCEKVCPSKDLGYAEGERLFQNEKESKWDAYIASAKDESIVKDAVSGGFISTLLEYALSSNEFDAIVTITGYDCRNPVYATIVENQKGLKDFAKSRYIPVLHTRVFEYILRNRDKKVVFVGVPCAVKALYNIITAYKLNKDNYLIVGLFCDRNFTYKINDYFSAHLADSQEIKQTYFRTKKYSKYPGNGLLVLENGTEIQFSARERTQVKDYFQMERCLYCVDKFAVEADISVGDNYTKESAANHSFGENNIIVRTDKGKAVLHQLSKRLVCRPVSAHAVKESQHMNERSENLDFLALKMSSDYGIPSVSRKKYQERCRKIRVGRKYTMNSNIIMVDLERRKWIRKVHKGISIIKEPVLRLVHSWKGKSGPVKFFL